MLLEPELELRFVASHRTGPKSGTRVQVPYFVLQGCHDLPCSVDPCVSHQDPGAEFGVPCPMHSYSIQQGKYCWLAEISKELRSAITENVS
jgi:hypothetical protein